MTTICLPDRRFLAHFDPRKRATVANLFLAPVRRGITEPRHIVETVRRDLLKEIGRWKWRTWGNPDGIQRNEQIIHLIDAHFSEALDLARYYLWWESLPAEEQRRIKAERWMAEQPATEKQAKYLRALGYTGKIESKLIASELIDKLLKKERTFV